MSRITLIAIIFSLFSNSFQSGAQTRELYDYLVKFDQFFKKGELKDAEGCLLKILGSKDSVSAEYLVIAYNDLGVVDNFLGKFDIALQYYHLAENVVIKNKLSSTHLAYIYINTGHIYTLKRSFPEAINYYEKGLRIYLDIKNPDKEIFHCISTGYLDLGLTYNLIGDYKQALEYLVKSSSLK